MLPPPSHTVFLTRPLLPDVNKFERSVEEIFASKWLTNMGAKHNELEQRLKAELKVPNLSVFNNGTIALLTALKALELPEGSEVITTPFTFAATPHAISWNGCKPVFCDIEPVTMTIDPQKIEALITPRTSAILGVHVYGFPCKVKEIQEIADRHHLKVIYDAAHAFSTEIDGKGIGTFGDITMFSFHATKLFNTIEGGALAYNDDSLVKRIYDLRDFGIRNEFEVGDIGINGKMNEFQAAMGLANLEVYREEQRKRTRIRKLYDERLSGVEGIYVPKMPADTTDSCQYFPIVIKTGECKFSRDELYEKFREQNILVRKYFYPACSDYPCYRDPKNAVISDLSVTDKVKNEVLCLPFYGDLPLEDAERICGIILK